MDAAAAKDKAPDVPKPHGASRPPRAPQWRGYLAPGASAQVMISVIIPALLIALVVLSVLGTFYGVQSLGVPILSPGTILSGIGANPGVFAVALIAQGVLMFTQYGASELAAADSRWWIVYLLSLGASVGLNWIGYREALASLGVPVLIAFGVVIAADVVPELAMKKRG